MSKQKMISVEKITQHIDEMMEMNDNAIENNMDGDGHCEIENMVLDNILHFIYEGRYD